MPAHVVDAHCGSCPEKPRRGSHFISVLKVWLSSLVMRSGTLSYHIWLYSDQKRLRITGHMHGRIKMPDLSEISLLACFLVSEYDAEIRRH